MRIFDAHFHIIDFDFPIIENHGYLPPSYNVEDYQNEVTDLNVLGGAIVSGSFQGFDQGYLMKALNQMSQHFVALHNYPLQ